VIPGTGAEAAGLRPGDRIVEVDGQPVASLSQLSERIAIHAVGDTVPLAFIRAGQRLTATVTLGPRPMGLPA
jgi:serine protease DegQ